MKAQGKGLGKFRVANLNWLSGSESMTLNLHSLTVLYNAVFLYLSRFFRYTHLSIFF